MTGQMPTCRKCHVSDATIFTAPTTGKPLKTGGYCRCCYEQIQAKSVRTSGGSRSGRDSDKRQDMRSMRGDFDGAIENAVRALEE